MRSGDISDFVAVGDVGIKVIGADNQILDSEVPVRQMMEQIITRLGLPPFILGLSWSSTERMSSQQADVLTKEMEAYRMLLNPSIVCQFSYCMFQLCGFYLTVSYIFHLFVEVLTVSVHSSSQFSDHLYDNYFELFIN